MHVDMHAFLNATVGGGIALEEVVLSHTACHIRHQRDPAANGSTTVSAIGRPQNQASAGIALTRPTPGDHFTSPWSARRRNRMKLDESPLAVLSAANSSAVLNVTATTVASSCVSIKVMSWSSAGDPLVAPIAA